MKRFTLGGVLLLCAGLILGGCRKRAGNRSGDEPPAPTEGAPAAAVAAGESGGPAAAPVTYAAPPPNYTPPTPALRFTPPKPSHMYSPAQPGDYQAQLDAYNQALRRWAKDTDIPRSLHDIMASFSCPKPPQPPPGRTLVYDKATISLRLQ